MSDDELIEAVANCFLTASDREMRAALAVAAPEIQRRERERCLVCRCRTIIEDPNIEDPDPIV